MTLYLDMSFVHLPVDEAIFSVEAVLGASLCLILSLSLFSLSFHLPPTLPRICLVFLQPQPGRWPARYTRVIGSRPFAAVRLLSMRAYVQRP